MATSLRKLVEDGALGEYGDMGFRLEAYEPFIYLYFKEVFVRQWRYPHVNPSEIQAECKWFLNLIKEGN